jgi:hypothetical protein
MRRSISLGFGWLAVAAAGAAVLVPAAPAGAASPIEGRLHAGKGTVTSTNWSGYAALGARFESARGTWTQPAANCSSVGAHGYAIAAFWVGLDGFESNTVEQTGTESDCAGAKPLYRAWYELYPERSFVVGGKVEAGDTMHAVVNQETITLEDATQKWTASERFLPGSLAFSSAEWIAEAPAKGHLTQFGSVHFQGAAASAGSVANGPIDDSAWSDDAIQLVGAHNMVLAEPGALEAAGTAFTITAKAEEGASKGKGPEHGKR